MNTIKENFLSLSTKVGDLFIPGSALEGVLTRYSELLCIWNHDEDHPISLCGSASLLEHNGRYFSLCSIHQVDGRNLEDICLLTSDCRAITSNGMRCFETKYRDGVTDAYDLIAFDFTDAVEAGALEASSFFPFSSVPPDCPNTHVLALLVAGFPFEDQIYDVADNKHLGTAKRVLYGNGYWHRKMV